MRKIPFLIYFIVFLCLSSYADTQEFNSQRDQNMVAQIETHVGSTFQIELPGNYTTGYVWSYKELIRADVETIEKLKTEPMHCLKEVSYAYKANSHSPGMVGAPGIATWVFEGTKSGKVLLEFSYGRPWEAEHSSQQQLFEITILE
jgi:predicted secreted protein